MRLSHSDGSWESPGSEFMKVVGSKVSSGGRMLTQRVGVPRPAVSMVTSGEDDIIQQDRCGTQVKPPGTYL